ncbi:MAG: phosphoribosyltransferase [Gammaproteobacteria bacterium]|nr:phosphoribosyltransferase [Gammaproteobacteria bacterium]
MTLFRDRRAAGRALAKNHIDDAVKKSTVVLAIPGGGVPVAYEIAKSLHAPMDIIIARKLSVPGNREWAMGAITSGGIRIINHDVVRLFNISQFAVDAVAAKEQEEIARQEQIYRGGWPALEIYGRLAIIVDDGIATGATMRTAALSIKQRNPAQIIAAAPTASCDSIKMLNNYVNKIICLSSPEPYIAVGRWYENFPQITEAEVSKLLIEAAKDLCASSSQKELH